MILPENETPVNNYRIFLLPHFREVQFSHFLTSGRLKRNRTKAMADASVRFPVQQLWFFTFCTPFPAKFMKAVFTAFLLLDKAYMFTYLFDCLIFLLIKDQLVLLEQIPSMSVYGDNQRTKFMNPACPECLWHSEILPVC